VSLGELEHPTNVDDAVSFTLGPLASPPAGLVPDAMYVVLEGKVAAPGAKTLNPTQFQQTCVAVVSQDAPPGTPGVAPTLIQEGLSLLPYHDAVAAPYQTASALLTPLSIEAVSVDNRWNDPEDTDGDGHLDVSDNCPYESNPDQENTGDLLRDYLDPLDPLDPLDADGDACECGDGDATGSIFPAPEEADLAELRAHLVGLATLDAGIAKRCSVVDGPACDLRDAAVLERALADPPLGPGLVPACRAALPDATGP
jgi:hypothetical protein